MIGHNSFLVLEPELGNRYRRVVLHRLVFFLFHGYNCQSYRIRGFPVLLIQVDSLNISTRSIKYNIHNHPFIEQF